MNLDQKAGFVYRHIGPRDHEIQDMLNSLDCSSLDDLVKQSAPKEIISQNKLNLPPSLTEVKCLEEINKYAEQNKIFTSYIGNGYYDTDLPPVIQRNILENPSWLTPYTPYQSEISQGRLQALLNFQTMITEMTEMEIANASLLDEATACAEAVTMAYRYQENLEAKHIFVDQLIFPQTLSVLRTRTRSMGIKIVLGSAKDFTFDPKKFFGIVIQYPSSNGQVENWQTLCEKAREKKIMSLFSADLLSLCLLKTPGEMGADIVTGSCQRMGLPMLCGGPHAGYLATREKYVRLVPGRIVGVSKDRHEQKALRLALQTREQHIRRERATSNICTAQALPAVLSSMYAIYHGAKGLKNIALSIHCLALSLAESLKKMNFKIKTKDIFDTVQIELSKEKCNEIYQRLLQNKINAYLVNPQLLSFSINETTHLEDIKKLLTILNPEKADLIEIKESKLPAIYQRKSACLKHPVFQNYHSETKFLRYIHKLQNEDLSLTHSMIPLGSCTMKLNGTTELLPVTWPKFSKIHPFAPLEQRAGYTKIINELEKALCEITGFGAVSFQANAGSQGEYAGLLVIRQYHEQRGEKERKICLIPSSAHGTNPASATMAGLKTVIISCDKKGNISHKDLKEKIALHKNHLAGLMITYPSTFGVFERHIPQICEWVHEAGGLVYLDGANMNALVGISRPAEWGADLCHLNLHKTFCIPHGGGGPGVGPLVVKKKLKDFLPSHHFSSEPSKELAISPISSAPWGSAGILMIPLAYIKLLGAEGLKKATQVALLNANYIAQKLKGNYKILYTGENERVAHECIVDLRKFKHSVEITVDDVAKRLIDYGFHAPTMNWPIPGTLMIEPTESEDQEELLRFVSALIEIRKEIKEIEKGVYDKKHNVLKNAPHTLADSLHEKWSFPYSKQKAFHPLPWVKDHKFWPSVSRVENAFGDINLSCSCPPIELETPLL